MVAMDLKAAIAALVEQIARQPEARRTLQAELRDRLVEAGAAGVGPGVDLAALEAALEGDEFADDHDDMPV